MTQDMPSEVLDEIRRAAKTDWPGDHEMQQHVIDSESEAYHALQALDFGEALSFKQAILDEASQYNETWEDRFNAVHAEVEAFAELAALSPDDVPTDLVAEMKQKAEGEGRSFRYPVTYIREGKEEKRKARVDDLQPEALITGHYKFGANELSIYRALVRIVDMLESDYGLKVARAGDEC